MEYRILERRGDPFGHSIKLPESVNMTAYELEVAFTNRLRRRGEDGTLLILDVQSSELAAPVYSGSGGAHAMPLPHVDIIINPWQRADAAEHIRAAAEHIIEASLEPPLPI